MSNPWGKKVTKDWSEQVEEEEAQNGGTLASSSPRSPVAADTGAFPTLGEAAKVKPKKKSKQVLSLAEFSTLGSSGRPAFGRGGPIGRDLTDREIVMNLPTGPRERDPNEPPRGAGRWGDRAGGGFRQEGYGNRFEERPRREEEGPSRADESDNWGREKKFVSGGGGGNSFGSGGRRDYGGGAREGGFERRGFADSYEESRGSRRGGGFDDMPGKTDADDWKRDNKFTPSSRGGGFGGGGGGGGFRESRSDNYDRGGSRGYGFRSRGDYEDPANRADTEDRWGSRRAIPDRRDEPPRERPRLQLQERTKPLPQHNGGDQLETKSSTRSNPFGDARPREEVLRERNSEVATDRMSSRSAGSDIGSHHDSHYGSRPTSRAGSIPGTPASAIDSMRSGQEPFHPKPRSDPFGGARPREDNLIRSGPRPTDTMDRHAAKEYQVGEISH
ncbi:hypothetical protein BSKO_04482 [Bryopsis sp. KO-2023]|nr:hypothetical protein BSKO_04482 [Bryopsis sp. KO-2023]